MEVHGKSTKTKHLATAKEYSDLRNKKLENYKTAVSHIKECFREYSLEDKVNVLKNMLDHNSKYVGIVPPHRKSICKIKEDIGVKEILQPVRETPFQTIICELRNTVMNSYWNKEVGKTHYQNSNLPVGMNLLVKTFGKKYKSGDTMADLLKQKDTEPKISKEYILELYKKSHNSYSPAEQIKRDYKKPFDKNLCFGKLQNADIEGVRMKNCLTWINTNPTTVVTSNLVDFVEHSRSCVGEVKNLKNMSMYLNMTHGKMSKKEESVEILSDCPINNDVMIHQQYLQYINSLRQRIKRHDKGISFHDIYENLLAVDNDYTGILPEEKVFSILDVHKVHVNKTFLRPVLDLLQIRVEQNVKYKELLNLLNWKYDLPTLPKVERVPLECQYYDTTYSATFADKMNIKSIPTAGILYKDQDKPTAYSLIVPNVFTKHGLSHSDLSKLRGKQEIRNIFESIGIKFPSNSFDFLWHEGLKRSATDINVSVDTFRNLLDEYDDLINKKNDHL